MIKMLNSLSLQLLQYFYDSNEYIHDDFREFMETDEYKAILHDLGYAYLYYWLTPNRWKVCEMCGRPFIATDQSNKAKFCTYDVYKRYNKRGVAFPSTKKQISNCVMIARQLRKRGK